MHTEQVYLSIGTNIGDRRENIDKALGLLNRYFSSEPVSLSPVLETEAWGFEGEDFLNCAVRYDLGISPLEVLRICKEIEAGMGRRIDAPEYDGQGMRIYRSRIIDIDILLFGKRRFVSDELVIPHPLMHRRDFVMIPLKEIVSREILDAFPALFEGYCR